MDAVICRVYGKLFKDSLSLGKHELSHDKTGPHMTSSVTSSSVVTANMSSSALLDNSNTVSGITSRSSADCVVTSADSFSLSGVTFVCPWSSLDSRGSIIQLLLATRTQFVKFQHGLRFSCLISLMRLDLCLRPTSFQTSVCNCRIVSGLPLKLLVAMVCHWHMNICRVALCVDLFGHLSQHLCLQTVSFWEPGHWGTFHSVFLASSIQISTQEDHRCSNPR
jgi:hypothetical protein